MFLVKKHQANQAILRSDSLVNVCTVHLIILQCLQNVVYSTLYNSYSIM